MEHSPTVFVTVGTDYHRFDRLIEWIDEWVDQDPPRGRVRVQHGTSKRPRAAESSEYMTYPEMEHAVREADVVVSHGGPGTIMLALTHGKRPIVVPRSASLGEHVDDHQAAFALRCEQDGTILLAQTRERLFDLLAAAATSPARVNAVREDRSEASVRRFAELVEGLVASRGPRRARSGRA
jgi:UDP-N-acetylglucosamine transferase subunit ALG13